MDIKKVFNLPQSMRESESSAPAERVIKSDSTTDREGNGQMPFGEGEQHREPMSDEQMEKAIEHLKAIAVVKENNLEVELVVQNEKRFILLKELSGKVIRRIPEAELWSLLRVKANEKGQILSKSA